jgi:hypothetical protein
MNKILALVTLFTFFSLSAEESEAPETVYFSDDSEFMCIPEKAKFGDKIVLTKTNSNLSELAVFREGSDTSHFIIVGSPPDGMTNLIAPNELATKNELTLNTVMLTGLEWKTGAKQELIFSKSGKYTFYISPNLESEIGGYKCVVNYQH